MGVMFPADARRGGKVECAHRMRGFAPQSAARSEISSCQSTTWIAEALSAEPKL